MLVDAAKHGDIEIPYFCYEPKLGQPVGACRMCMVEIEGIPKLQTSCSTPVKDGMVVHTQTERVRHAQNAVVEFLLVNHPLDCPVCDKGGECPLQDITFGWGLGRSRFIEPKRHFEKPLALSPLVAIDRERCILCYRCVRFSQEIAEDYQLIFAERGAHTFVATHDGHPYVAPFSGNIIELCPVGALTSQPYRFRARPWDIEGAGGICTLCPSQCNVEFTVRDEKVMRVLAREHPERRRRLAVRQGPLRLPGDPRRRADHRPAGPRRRRAARGLVGARARGGGRARQAPGPRRRARRRPGDQRGGVPARAADARGPRLLRHRLGDPNGGPDRAGRERSPHPRCRPRSPTSSSRTRCWWSAASRSTTLRSSTCGSARACAATVSSWRLRPRGRARSTPTRSWSCATSRARRTTFLEELVAALAGESDAVAPAHAELAELLRDGGEDVVIVWGERLDSVGAASCCWASPSSSALRTATAPGCSRSRPGRTAADCARRARCPTAGPGYAELPRAVAARLRSPPPPPRTG